MHIIGLTVYKLSTLCKFHHRSMSASCLLTIFVCANFFIFFADIQGKLQAQLKCLEEKVETQTGMVSEIQDFFKRRADIEIEYSQKLEKLAKHCLAKQKQEKLKYVCPQM